MPCTRRDVLRQAARGLLAGLFPALSGAKAQSAFPTQPIRLVVPFSAGGTADVLARAIGARLLRKHA